MNVRDQQRLADVRKVLILRLDKIGDMILSTPAIRNIREGLPSSHLTLIASPYNAPVVRGLPYLDEVREYDKSWPLPVKKEFARGLQNEHYDLCIALSPTTETYQLAYWSKAPTRAAILYAGRIVPRMLALVRLTHPLVVDVDGAVRRKEQVPHEVRQMLQLNKLIGLPDTEYPLEIPVNRDDVEWASKLASEQCSGRTLIGVHLSERWFSSGWTGLGLALLFDEIIRTIPDSSIIATYGPADTSAVEQVAHYIDVDDGIGLSESLKGRVLLAGGVSFGRWAGLTSLCSVVLTRDTGSLHLAAALGRPVLAIYEKGAFSHNAQQWAPWKVPHFSMESGYFSETSAEILSRLTALISESSNGEPGRQSA
jgi:ADP-heptose:LPS heptosyltransferase